MDLVSNLTPHPESSLKRSNTDKELWEPTISALLLPVDQSPSVKQPAIREAWAFDAPDHGDSAVANRTVLENSKDGVRTSHATCDHYRLFTNIYSSRRMGNNDTFICPGTSLVTQNRIGGPFHGQYRYVRIVRLWSHRMTL